MSTRRWPQIATERREVIEARTRAGGACTMICWRNAEDGLVISLDSTNQCAVALSPDELDRLLGALHRLSAP